MARAVFALNGTARGRLPFPITNSTDAGSSGQKPLAVSGPAEPERVIGARHAIATRFPITITVTKLEAHRFRFGILPRFLHDLFHPLGRPPADREDDPPVRGFTFPVASIGQTLSDCCLAQFLEFQPAVDRPAIVFEGPRFEIQV